MSTTQEQMLWATLEFGEAQLQDPRLTQRAVHMAAAIAARPADKVTEIFTPSAARLGAYRFLENPHVSAAALSAAAAEAASRRCRGHAYVYVAVDQTDLHIVDTKEKKGLGD